MKYTNIQILEYIKRFYDENGRIPTSNDFKKKNGYPSRGTVEKYFGSWNNAIKEAGFGVNRMNNLTDEELLDYLRKYEEEYGKTPTQRDLYNGNYKYPSLIHYVKRFGNFEKAKKLVGQDLDTRARKGILDHPKQKARLAEIFVIEHFVEEGAVDLAGENCTSHVDGICPKNQIYDVKSSRWLDRDWQFHLDKGESVDFYYLLAFNEDYSELKHAWRIPRDFTEGQNLHISLNDIMNMKKYEITEKFKDVFNKWRESLGN